MKKFLVTAFLVAASLLVVGTSLTANATSKTTPCKSVKVAETKLVWNAKHTKKITVDVFKLVKETVKVKGKTKVVYVEVHVYKETKICTAGISVTSTTIGPVSVPVTTTTQPAPPTVVYIPAPTTTTVPITTTTTTVPPTTTTTTLPGQSSIITSTTMAPVNTSYPNTCLPTSYCYNETVFSVVVSAPGSDVAPGAGRVWFVFDAPVTDTDGGDYPWQFNQFTLETTENGQTACPLQWQSGQPIAPPNLISFGVPPIWEAAPSSVATDGIPACTMTDVVLEDNTATSTSTGTTTNYACTYPQPFYGPPNNGAQPGSVVAPCGADSPIDPAGAPSNYEPSSYEPGESLMIIGTPLNWSVTAEFIGDGPDAPSFSMPQNFVVTIP